MIFVLLHVYSKIEVSYNNSICSNSRYKNFSFYIENVINISGLDDEILTIPRITRREINRKDK